MELLSGVATSLKLLSPCQGWAANEAQRETDGNRTQKRCCLQQHLLKTTWKTVFGKCCLLISWTNQSFQPTVLRTLEKSWGFVPQTLPAKHHHDASTPTQNFQQFSTCKSSSRGQWCQLFLFISGKNKTGKLLSTNLWVPKKNCSDSTSYRRLLSLELVLLASWSGRNTEDIAELIMQATRTPSFGTSSRT